MNNIIFLFSYIFAVSAFWFHKQEKTTTTENSAVEHAKIKKEIKVAEKLLRNMQIFLDKLLTLNGKLSTEMKTRSQETIKNNEYFQQIFSILGSLNDRERITVAESFDNEIRLRLLYENRYKNLFQNPIVKKTLKTCLLFIKETDSTIWKDIADKLHQAFLETSIETIDVAKAVLDISSIGQIRPNTVMSKAIDYLNSNKRQIPGEFITIIEDFNDYISQKNIIISHQAKLKQKVDVDKALTKSGVLAEIVKRAMATFDLYADLTAENIDIIQKVLESFWETLSDSLSENEDGGMVNNMLKTSNGNVVSSLRQGPAQKQIKGKSSSYLPPRKPTSMPSSLSNEDTKQKYHQSFIPLNRENAASGYKKIKSTLPEEHATTWYVSSDEDKDDAIAAYTDNSTFPSQKNQRELTSISMENADKHELREYSPRKRTTTKTRSEEIKPHIYNPHIDVVSKKLLRKRTTTKSNFISTEDQKTHKYKLQIDILSEQPPHKRTTTKPKSKMTEKRHKHKSHIDKLSKKHKHKPSIDKSNEKNEHKTYIDKSNEKHRHKIHIDKSNENHKQNSHINKSREKRPRKHTTTESMSTENDKIKKHKKHTAKIREKSQKEHLTLRDESLLSNKEMKTHKHKSHNDTFRERPPRKPKYKHKPTTKTESKAHKHEPYKRILREGPPAKHLTTQASSISTEDPGEEYEYNSYAKESTIPRKHTQSEHSSKSAENVKTHKHISHTDKRHEKLPRKRTTTEPSSIITEDTEEKYKSNGKKSAKPQKQITFEPTSVSTEHVKNDKQIPKSDISGEKPPPLKHTASQHSSTSTEEKENLYEYKSRTEKPETRNEHTPLSPGDKKDTSKYNSSEGQKFNLPQKQTMKQPTSISTEEKIPLNNVFREHYASNQVNEKVPPTPISDENTEDLHESHFQKSTLPRTPTTFIPTSMSNEVKKYQYKSHDIAIIEHNPLLSDDKQHINDYKRVIEKSTEPRLPKRKPSSMTDEDNNTHNHKLYMHVLSEGTSIEKNNLQLNSDRQIEPTSISKENDTESFESKAQSASLRQQTATTPSTTLKRTKKLTKIKDKNDFLWVQSDSSLSSDDNDETLETMPEVSKPALRRKNTTTDHDYFDDNILETKSEVRKSTLPREQTTTEQTYYDDDIAETKPTLPRKPTTTRRTYYEDNVLETKREDKKPTLLREQSTTEHTYYNDDIVETKQEERQPTLPRKPTTAQHTYYDDDIVETKPEKRKPALPRKQTTTQHTYYDEDIVETKQEERKPNLPRKQTTTENTYYDDKIVETKPEERKPTLPRKHTTTESTYYEGDIVETKQEKRKPTLPRKETTTENTYYEDDIVETKQEKRKPTLPRIQTTTENTYYEDDIVETKQGKRKSTLPRKQTTTENTYYDDKLVVTKPEERKPILPRKHTTTESTYYEDDIEETKQEGRKPTLPRKQTTTERTYYEDDVLETKAEVRKSTLPQKQTTTENTYYDDRIVETKPEETKPTLPRKPTTTENTYYEDNIVETKPEERKPTLQQKHTTTVHSNYEDDVLETKTEDRKPTLPRKKTTKHALRLDENKEPQQMRHKASIKNYLRDSNDFQWNFTDSSLSSEYDDTSFLPPTELSTASSILPNKPTEPLAASSEYNDETQLHEKHAAFLREGPSAIKIKATSQQYSSPTTTTEQPSPSSDVKESLHQENKHKQKTKSKQRWTSHELAETETNDLVDYQHPKSSTKKRKMGATRYPETEVNETPLRVKIKLRERPGSKLAAQSEHDVAKQLKELEETDPAQLTSTESEPSLNNNKESSQKIHKMGTTNYSETENNETHVKKKSQLRKEPGSKLAAHLSEHDLAKDLQEVIETDPAQLTSTESEPSLNNNKESSQEKREMETTSYPETENNETHKKKESPLRKGPCSKSSSQLLHHDLAKDLKEVIETDPAQLTSTEAEQSLNNNKESSQEKREMGTTNFPETENNETHKKKESPLRKGPGSKSSAQLLHHDLVKDLKEVIETDPAQLTSTESEPSLKKHKSQDTE